MKNIQDTEFGVRLRTERKRLGLTQARLAELGGVSIGSQNAYESGLHRPDSAYLANVSRAGVNIFYVVLGHGVGVGIDWQAILEITDIINIWASQRPQPPPLELRSHFLQVFYEQYCSTRRLNPDQYAATLKHVG